MSQAQFKALWEYLDAHYFTELSLGTLEEGLAKIQQSVAEQDDFPVIRPNLQENDYGTDSEGSGGISFSHHF